MPPRRLGKGISISWKKIQSFLFQNHSLCLRKDSSLTKNWGVYSYGLQEISQTGVWLHFTIATSILCHVLFPLPPLGTHNSCFAICKRVQNLFLLLHKHRVPHMLLCSKFSHTTFPIKNKTNTRVQNAPSLLNWNWSSTAAVWIEGTAYAPCNTSLDFGFRSASQLSSSARF